MADEGLQAASGQEEKGALRPEKENTASWPVFWPEEVSHMAVPAKLDELHLKNRPNRWPMMRNLGMGGDCRIIPVYFLFKQPYGKCRWILRAWLDQPSP
jgi:hypothetical protein